MWNIGGGLIYHEQLLWLIDSLKERYQLDHLITAVHDCHQGMIWNGGRVIIRNTRMTKESAIEVIREYNRRGVAFYLTFNNTLIEDVHLKDSRCNYLLENAYAPGNGVVCSSEPLRRYLRSHFPDYKLVHSCSPNRKDLDYYKQAQDRYDLVVLAPDCNTDYDLIDQLDKSRLEILVNEECLFGCPFREKHYDLINRAILFRDWDLIEATFDFCRRHHGREKDDMTDARMLGIGPDVVERLRGMGIAHFKIQGRTEPTGEKMRRHVRQYVLTPEKIHI